MKALLISGDRSGSGKTSISVAIAALLSKRMKVQTFKVGMDYIDPSYLTGVTGRPCRNLDSFVLSPGEIREIFEYACQGADFALIEGVRGLYEGAEPVDDIGSTASVAKMLDLPVILVIDARSITRSAAAMIQGFRAFDPAVRISGIILNNVKGEEHVRKLTDAIRHFCNIPVIGAIPRLDSIDLTMRHLGLVPYAEGSPDHAFLNRIESMVQKMGSCLDLDLILSLSKELVIPPYSGEIFAPADNRGEVTIGVARDEAFNFYYADLFPVLSSLGATVEFFSPVSGDLPDADGYIIGGGYPEYFAGKLEENETMRSDIRKAAASGTPVYAECGGLMYLCEQIRFAKAWQGLPDGSSFRMCGVFPAESVIPARRVVRYVVGESSADTPFGKAGFRGHAFHYSDVRFFRNVPFGFSLSRGVGITGLSDGVLYRNTIGSYTHLHPVQARSMVRSFCDRCKNP